MALSCVFKHIKSYKIIQNTHRHIVTIPFFNIQHETPTVRKIGNIPQGFYGGRHTVTLLPGAGIGPELADYVKEIFRFTGVPVDFEEIEIDADPSSDDLEYALTSIRRNGIALKGNISEANGGTRGRLDDSAELATFGNAILRRELDLYVNAVHCVSYPGVPCRYSDIDISIIRQNTEGEYAMLEHQTVEGVVESMKVISRSNAERIIRYAFEYARQNNRKKITTVHKANIMKLSDGLFLSTAHEIATSYPDIIHTDMIVDNACMQLVANPHQFDMLLTTNLYGSVISNVLCGLLGGAGLYSGRNISERFTIFEPATRSTGASIAGRNIANPIAMLSAAIDMLRHLGRHRHADLLRAGVLGSIEDGVVTRDLGGTATTREVVDNILRHVEIAAIAAIAKEN